MKNERRNDKVHQNLELQAYREAEDAKQQLHKLLAKPGHDGLSVGEMVNVAARMGLLQPASVVKSLTRKSNHRMVLEVSSSR